MMRIDLIAKIEFAKELRDKWPTKVFTADVRTYSKQSATDAWSIRARLFNPPDINGTAMAALSFLSSSAPIMDMISGGKIRLTLGNTILGYCTAIANMQGQSKITEHDCIDGNFLSAGSNPIRYAVK